MPINSNWHSSYKQCVSRMPLNVGFKKTKTLPNNCNLPEMKMYVFVTLALSVSQLVRKTQLPKMVIKFKEGSGSLTVYNPIFVFN